MFMLLLLVHQSQFVTIWRHPVVTTSKDSRFHFPIPKWPPGVALWDQYRYIFKTATDRTAGGSVPRIYTLHKEALLLAG